MEKYGRDTRESEAIYIRSRIQLPRSGYLTPPGTAEFPGSSEPCPLVSTPVLPSGIVYLA